MNGNTATSAGGPAGVGPKARQAYKNRAFADRVTRSPLLSLLPPPEKNITGPRLELHLHALAGIDHLLPDQ